MSTFLLKIALICVILAVSVSADEFIAITNAEQKEQNRLDFLRTPPVIDIAPLVHTESFTDADRAEVQNKIYDASHHWGFFQVINHGIDPVLQDELINQMKIFFNSPQEVKYTIRRSENNSRGFADDELTKRLKDVKEILDIGQVPYTDLSPEALLNQNLDGVNQWPSVDDYPHLAGLKPTSDAYYAQCLTLSQTLVRALSAVIPCGDADYFKNAFDHHSSFLRLNFYPVLTDGVDAGAVESAAAAATDSSPTNQPLPLPLRLGVSRHTDAGALTVLFQDPNPAVLGGLEVYSGSKEDAGDGVWVPVIPVPGALTINTGDMMQVWSNGLLKAPEHRVRPTIVSERVRYSAPFFYNPNYDAIVRPVNFDCVEAEMEVEVKGDSSGDSSVSGSSSDSNKNIASSTTPTTPTTPSTTHKLHYAPIRWGDYRNVRFQGDFKDVGEEIQIEHFQAA